MQDKTRRFKHSQELSQGVDIKENKNFQKLETNCEKETIRLKSKPLYQKEQLKVH